MNLNDSVSSLSGVGKKRLEQLNKLGICIVKDLLEYFPRDYDDRSEIKNISHLIAGQVTTIRGFLNKPPENLKINGLIITKTALTDSTGTLEIVWYNQQYMKNIAKGEYIFTGRVSEKYGRMKLENPDYELIDGNELLSNGRIIPIYRSAENLSQKFFRKMIKHVIDNVEGELVEFLSDDLLMRHELCKRDYAVRNIHFPESSEAFSRARKRLVFEELLIMQMSLIKMKGKRSRLKFTVDDFDLSGFYKLLPFNLTESQAKVMEEILGEMKKGFAVNRLIQGDVGSGKTIVASAIGYLIIKNGFQCALMAPTEVLARQHYKSIKGYFDSLGVETVLLIGNMSKRDKDSSLKAISENENLMVVGTHAVIQDRVTFCKLGLVITDEQHRFGVMQRLALWNKGGENINVLVMSATPVPRTLAMILYGDMDVSVISGMPPGRQKIDTFYVNSGYRERMYGFIRKELEANRQAYMICPQIEESETLKSVKSHTEEISKAFDGYRVECMHGKLNPTKKQEIMDSFAAGETDILVSTTVIEVGINVPNATIMTIENAERFGLSQLHQLRGRVGRGSEKSYCILVTDSKSPTTLQRMKVMKEHADGFKISELDLAIRGAGDFFGTRQHGLPEFKIANLYEDLELLDVVREAALEIYDSTRGHTENAALNKAEENLSTIINECL